MRANRPVLLIAPLVLGIAVLPAGCPPTGGVQQTGTLRLLVTDKPYPFDLIEIAQVTITRVDVLLEDTENVDEEGTNEPAGEDNGEHSEQADPTQENDGDGENTDGEAENGTEDEELDDDDSDFITIFEGEKTFNLLDLQNGQTDLLADTEIPAGTYTQMRLVVTGGYLRLFGDERSFDLRVPSGEQTGIKLHFTFEVAADEETVLLLDVDLSRTFKPTPGGKIDDPSSIQEFKFQPSLGMRLINLLEAGSVAGTVTDGEANLVIGAAVTAYNDDAEVTSTATGDDGTYVLSGLATGTYRVEVSATGFADAALEDVAVTAGEQTAGIDRVLTPEQP